METKTPRTTIKDYLQNVGTENEARRSLRRRSVARDPKEGSCSQGVPILASKQSGIKDISSPRGKNRRSLAISEEDEVTPRHIIQDMLSVQATAQPVTRRKRHMSDVAMGPPSSSSIRKSARRQSVSLMDLDDITHKYTPRTNIAGFLEQAPEETPAVRKSGTATDSHSTTQNVSSFMLNEVDVSLLEARSDGNALVNVSASAARFQGKKRKLIISLPQISPVRPSETPGSTRGSRTSTPKQNRSASASTNENAAITASEVVSSVSSPPHTDAQDTNSSKSRPEDTSVGVMNTLGEERSRDSGRNVFSDIFGEGENTARESEEPEEIEAVAIETVEQRPEQEIEGRDLEMVEQRPQQEIEAAALETVEQRPEQEIEGRDLEMVEQRPQQEIEAAALETVEQRPEQEIEGRDLEMVEQRPQQEIEAAALETVEQRPEQEIEGRDLEMVEQRPQQEIEAAALETVEERPEQEIEGRDLEMVEQRPQQEIEAVALETVEQRPEQEIEAAGVETLERRSEQETDHVQGGFKAQTPSAALSSSRRKGGGTPTPSKATTSSGRRKGDSTPTPTKAMPSSSRRKGDSALTPTKSVLSSRRKGDSTPTPTKAVQSSSRRKSDGTRTPTKGTPSSSRRKGDVTPTPTKFPPRSSRSSSQKKLTQLRQSSQSPPRSSRSSSQKKLTQLRQSSSTKASPAERRQSTSPILETSNQETVPMTSTPVSKLRSSKKMSLADSRQNMPSHSELMVSQFSRHFENRESTHVLRHESEAPPEQPPAQQTEEIEDGTSVFARTATENFEMPTDWPLDQEEESSEGEEYSPLKTPKLPEKQRTPSTALSRLSNRNENAEKTESAPTAGTKRKVPAASRSAKKPRLGLPTSVVKTLFSHFCPLRVSKEAITEVEKVSEQYWKNMAEDLEAYALHAGRKTINESDVELLMRRQGFITNTCSLNTLIAKYLPLELRQKMIPIARSGNKLEPKC